MLRRRVRREQKDQDALAARVASRVRKINRAQRNLEQVEELLKTAIANETLKEELAREEQRFRTDIKGRVDHKENGGSGGSESEDGSP